MQMELGFQGAWVRGHPADEGLRLGVTLSSDVCEWQWPVSDVSTGQDWVLRKHPPPDASKHDILNFDLAEPPYHCLHNGDRNTLSLPGACMIT